MKPLELIPLAGEDPRALPTERLLTIGIGDIAYGCAVAARVLDLRLFTSVHVLADQHELRETTIGKPRLTRDNPFLDERELRNLDANGLVCEGVRVAVGDALASIVVADLRSGGRRLKPAEKGMQWVTNRTWRVCPGWGGAVVAVARRQQREELGPRPPRGLWERIEIVLRRERPLQVGDVLLVADRPMVVSSFISEPPRDSVGNEADIVVPRKMADELGLSSDRFVPLSVAKGNYRAEEALQSRNIGPYSLIGQGPLGRPPYCGQAVSSAQIAWLHRRGFSALVGELSSLKCDDVVNRPQLASLAERPPGCVLDLPTPAAPQSLAEVAAFLAALGLNVELAGREGHVSIRIRPATAEEVKVRSSGRISKPETIHYRTYEDIDDGLFAPNVFGPSDWSRRQRFGHIDMGVPIVPFLFRVGEPSLLARATGLDGQDVERVVRHRADVLWRDDGPCVIDRPGPGNAADGERLGTGAVAIEALLHKTADRLPEGPRSIIPSLTTNVLPVLPPDWRPLVLLDSGNFATSDLNDLYRRVINRNNRLRKLVELKAPQVIVDNESRELQEAADSLYANTLVPKTILGSQGKPLVDIVSLILGRLQKDEKRVDWSGAARLIPDAAVPPHQLLVPGTIFETLRLAESFPLMLAVGQDGRIIARQPKSDDGPVLRVSPKTFARLAGRAAAPVARVYRPVTEAGRKEALRLMCDDDEPVTADGDFTPRSWLGSETAADLAVRLVDAAMSGEWTPLASPRGLLIGGTGSTRLAADAKEADRGQQRRQVPIPVEEAPRFSEPTFDEMLAVARRYIRNACVFEVRRASEPPPPGHGRVGGEPFLPSEIEWPRYAGQPLSFFGQFPLDPAREAGILSIDVSPRSMLTVFGGYDCCEPGPCHPRCPVFIHSLDNLAARPAPSDLKDAVSLYEIHPKIVAEAPGTVEMKEILQWELNNPKPGLLQEFCRKHLPELPPAAGGIKVGGWPKWVQGADSARPLLLQITEPMFRYGGVLYIFVEENGKFSYLSQFD
jgi:hypothetical protein